MKGYNLWSYHPYKPPLFKVGDIYICRVVPYENKIHFEWLAEDGKEYSVYYRQRGEGEFIFLKKVMGDSCDIEELIYEKEYEFYVECEGKKSRIRLARCGTSTGTVVNYLHPEDEAYSFSGMFLCSPCLVRHPDGFLLASMDVFGPGRPQNLTMIFRSDDDGETWHYVSELMPCFWGQMFIHNGELYMLSASTEYGDLLIGKSVDGGKTFTAPVALLRGSNGKYGKAGVHRYPQNTHYFGNRIYIPLEWGSWNASFCHAAMVMSCDVNSDLLDPESWSFTEPREYDESDPLWIELNEHPINIEGTIVTAPDGRLLNIMRHTTNKKEKKVIVYEVNTEDHEAPLKYSHRFDFPSHSSKFIIRFDEVSGRYYSLASRYMGTDAVRNLMSLMYSTDLLNWELAADILDFRDQDPKLVGVQYVHFDFDGDDIIFLCRTALNGADTFHNTNYSTFHRIKNFRKL